MQINKELNNLPFDLPKNKSNVIKVIGIGGGVATLLIICI